MKKFIILSIVIVLTIALIIRIADDQNYEVNNSSTSSTQNTQISNKPKDNIPTSQTSLSKPPIDIYSEKENNDRLASYEMSKLSSSKPNQIFIRTGYVVSYNSSTKNPNWVGWHLTKEHTDGPYPRKGIPYYDDNGTVIGIGIINNENYRSGYFLDDDINGPRQEFDDWKDKRYYVNHGHLCPAGDNRWSKAAMNQSFYLSNICPQDIDLNGGDWEGLERRCRGWAKQYDDIYIIAGPVFYNEHYRTLGEGKIGIPDAFFKVILRMKNAIGKNDPRALGFIFPNEGTHHDLIHYQKTVDEIEEITGLDFFYNLPDETEEIVESSSNIKLW